MKFDRDAAVAGFVAGAAFIASAQHIWHVTELAGNPGVIAALHPAAIDGLIYIGIRSVQKGRRGQGAFAVAYGAAYSVAFNASSYGMFRMPAWALAACLPIALVAAVLIVHGGGHREPVPVEPVPVVEPAPVPIPVRIPRPRSAPTSGGPAIGWDMDKAVDMLRREEADADIRTATGASVKSLRRTKQVFAAIKAGQADADIVRPGNITLGLVARVRRIMEAT
jgi:hypothetical protein